MKVDIITFHFVNNFGGALQAYAMQKALEKYCNAEAEIIDYRNGFILLTDFVRLFPVTVKVSEIVSGIRTMPDRIKRIKKFKLFRKEHMQLTKSKYTQARLRLDPPGADAYICGSDQIWNPFLTFGIRGMYFLDFVKVGKKISYAPSFGIAVLPAIYKNKVKKYLLSFDNISIRERSGKKLIKKLTGRDAKQLIDPTFLIDVSDWEKVSSNTKKKAPYMLLYIMQSDPNMYEYAKSLKKRLGLRIVEISRYGYNPGFVDETLVNVGPSDFLPLFKNADYICTNSYHGFIFSLIFEKRFCLIPCKRFKARIYNLADMLSIKINETKAEEALDTEYDPQRVREMILMQRENALSWLCKQLRG